MQDHESRPLVAGVLGEDHAVFLVVHRVDLAIAGLGIDPRLVGDGGDDGEGGAVGLEEGDMRGRRLQRQHHETMVVAGSDHDVLLSGGPRQIVHELPAVLATPPPMRGGEGLMATVRCYWAWPALSAVKIGSQTRFGARSTSFAHLPSMVLTMSNVARAETLRFTRPATES